MSCSRQLWIGSVGAMFLPTIVNPKQHPWWKDRLCHPLHRCRRTVSDTMPTTIHGRPVRKSRRLRLHRASRLVRHDQAEVRTSRSVSGDYFHQSYSNTPEPCLKIVRTSILGYIKGKVPKLKSPVQANYPAPERSLRICCTT